jgi:hypothetical protein
MAKSLAPMTASEWFDLFEHGLRSLGDRLPQALRLNGSGEQWIQAQLSLYAWYQHDMEIWSGDRNAPDLPGRLFTHDQQMAVEIKYLRKPRRERLTTTAPLDRPSAVSDASLCDDIERLKSLQGYQHRFMVVVSADGIDNAVDTDTLTHGALMQRQFAVAGGSIRVCQI